MHAGDAASAVRLLAKALRLCPALGPQVRGQLRAAEMSLAARAGSGAGAGAGGAGAGAAAAAAAAAAAERRAAATPAMREAVRRVLAARAGDHAAVLGVPRGAGEAEVRRAYLRLAKALHTDRNTAEGALEAFQRVGAAKDAFARGEGAGAGAGSVWGDAGEGAAAAAGADDGCE